MAVECVNTDKAPQAVGPYSQAVWAGNLLFISGQIPIDPQTNELNLFNRDAGEQTKLILKNMKAILESQGLTIKDIAKVTIFLDSMTNFDKVNQVYASFFNSHKPARACVEVARLPKHASVEIDAVAFGGDRKNT